MNKPITMVRLALMILFSSALMLAGQNALAAKHAAKMIYAFGDVTATGKEGTRQLRKGDFVFSGDTVTTARGRAQIRFTDGGFVSLQPNTNYRLDEYNYEGSADGGERSFFSLLKGSVRFVTGIVGKANNKNFRIKTSVATIGIRGSAAALTAKNGEFELVVLDKEITVDFGTGEDPLVYGAGSGVLCSAATGACTELPQYQTRAEVDDDDDSQKKGQKSTAQQETSDDFARSIIGAFDEPDINTQQNIALVTGTPDGEGGFDTDLDFAQNVTVALGSFTAIGDFVEDGSQIVEVITTDPLGLQGLVDEIGPELSSLLQDGIDGLDSELIQTVVSNPADVSRIESEDGEIRIDTLQNGNVLAFEYEPATMEVFGGVIMLQNHQAAHIVSTGNIDPISFFGTALYDFYAGTTSNAINGSAMGEGITSGTLFYDFLWASGSVDFWTNFDDKNFNVIGPIERPDTDDLVNPTDTAIFRGGDNLQARYTPSGGSPQSFGAHVEGVFGASASAPQYAGLVYEVEYYGPSMNSNHFIGAGIFKIRENHSSSYPSSP